jgi:hypothetical protein
MYYPARDRRAVVARHANSAAGRRPARIDRHDEIEGGPMKTATWKLHAACLAMAFAAGASLSVFAQAPEPNGAAGAAPGAEAPPGAAPQPGRPRPYKDLLKDARTLAGFFALHQKDDKVWIEIRPEQFGQPFFFAYNIPRSIGERGLYGSQMGRSHIAFFRRIGDRVQLVARNDEFFAAQGTPQARFVAQSFSDSLIASAALASLPNPETKAVLVEANALLFADIPGYLTRLEIAFRIPFALDARNTAFTQVSNNERLTGLQVRAHFAVPKLPAPPLNPAPTPVPTPPPPRTTPDPRSLFVSFYYSFAQLPIQPLAPRLADQRLGHFTTSRVDYSDDTAIKPRVHYVDRWRLEKKDPSATLSEPKQPIVFWIDRNVPEKYRKSVAAGVLEWNRAFERIGFKDALVVKQQSEKDGFSTMDAGHASIRWFSGADVGFAIGPSRVDPRSGEILDADIGMSDVFARGARRLLVEDVGQAAALADPLRAHGEPPACSYAAEAAGEMHFAADLLEARGLEMDGPEAEAIAQAYVKDVIMHEVGHTLGLRHNFRASMAYTNNQISDPEFTRKNGVTASVMDYTPFNLALAGEKQGEYLQSTIGPYDYWAIEYAYAPLDPAREKADLAKIAARSTEPWLAYGTDEDAGYGTLLGIDPDVNRFDLGPDPIDFYKRRVKLSRELWNRIESLQLAPGESYERLTRSLVSGFAAIVRIAPLTAKYVGGVSHRRDMAGTGRPLYEPTPVARQREALALITRDFFKADSFRFKPEFLSRIGIDHFERPRNPIVSIAEAVLNVQKAILDHLMSDAVAARLLDSQDKVADGNSVLRLSALHETLQSAIWSEAKTGAETTALRRNLQREHLRRITTVLLKPPAGMPADAVSLSRDNARQLTKTLREALAKRALSKETRAHYAESLNALEESLKAPLQRSGV